MAADLARLSRLWLLSPTPLRRYSPQLPSLCRNLGTTCAMRANPKASRPRSRPSSRASRTGPDSDNKAAVKAESNTTFLVPNTLVAPPIWRYPRQPKKFLHFLWLNLRNRVESAYSTFGIWFMSAPQWFRTWPRFKPGRSAAIPIAKALHIQMSEALAAGDKDCLRQICTTELFQSLGGIIDLRPKGTRADWELLRYEENWYYPRIADFRATYQPLQTGNGMRLIKQATVSIASVQRIARIEAGKKVPGSERVRHMIEHIVLHSEVDPHTFKSKPWKIWGNLPETTYEEYLDDKENLEALASQQNQSKF